MLWIDKTYQAPLNSGQVSLGRTLPALLDQSCDRTPNAQALNQWTETGWQPLSNQAFQTTAEAVALGLLDLGLQAGDRVALLMYSDVHFCIADMGCLLAHLVNVPIDLTQTLEHILFVLRHSEARALVISNLDLLAQITPYLEDAPNLEFVIVAEVPSDWQHLRSKAEATPISEHAPTVPDAACLGVPVFLPPTPLECPCLPLPSGFQLVALEELRTRGIAHHSTPRCQELRAALSPQDLATLIYIPDETGQLQGVMLSHENLSANALAAFSGIPNLELGPAEVVLSFLPLNHVFARSLLYGHMHHGHSIYFSNPNRVVKHLKEVKPTILATVPLLLEKIHSKILEKGHKLPSLPARLVFQVALNLAKRYQLGKSPNYVYALLLKLADRLVLSKWRSLFGGRLKYLLSGGAALKAELANEFAAAGVMIFQGYGLTQTSSVICYNRGDWNRAGTVGVPIAGAELAIAGDGEILVRGPYVTAGYYKNPTATQQAIDAEGWFHTGDLGRFTAEGFLQLTGIKKALFKLSTGKYIAPQPIEQRLQRSPLVAQAVVVGSERKFCAVLLVPNLEALRQHALETGLDVPWESLLQHPCILAQYQAVVTAANCHLPYWGTVKRFHLLSGPFTVDNGLLTADQQINRAQVIQSFAAEIEALYQEASDKGSVPSRKAPAQVPDLDLTNFACPPVPESSCPAFAQSLNPRLTT